MTPTLGPALSEGFTLPSRGGEETLTIEKRTQLPEGPSGPNPSSAGAGLPDVGRKANKKGRTRRFAPQIQGDKKRPYRATILNSTRRFLARPAES